MSRHHARQEILPERPTNPSNTDADLKTCKKICIPHICTGKCLKKCCRPLCRLELCRVSSHMSVDAPPSGSNENKSNLATLRERRYSRPRCLRRFSTQYQTPTSKSTAPSLLQAWRRLGPGEIPDRPNHDTYRHVRGYHMQVKLLMI